MKLELKHLSPYLPYGLSGIFRRKKEVLKSCTISFINREILYADFQPILRPLSDLTKKIEINGEKFVCGLKLVDPNNTEWDKMVCEFYNPFKKIPNHSKWIRVTHDKLGEIIVINPNNIEHLPYMSFKKLIEWHFDVFGLIEEGLAVDINTLKQ